MAAVGAAASPNRIIATRAAAGSVAWMAAMESRVRKPRKAMPSHFSGFTWVRLRPILTSRFSLTSVTALIIAWRTGPPAPPPARSNATWRNRSSAAAAAAPLTSTVPSGARVSGPSRTAKVTVDGEDFLLTANQSTYIPLGAVHRLENPGTETLELIEVQSGSYLGEDDIVRYEDIYQRS